MKNNRNKKRRSKKSWLSGHKLEFSIYVIGVLVICLVIFGIIKLATHKKVENKTSSVMDSTVSISQSIAQESHSEENSHTNESGKSQISSNSNDSSGAGTVNSTDYISYSKTGAEEANEWYLRVVNNSTRLPDGWSDSQITKVYNSNNGEYYRIDTRIVNAYNDMVAAAKKDGVNLYIISGYRDQSTQERLFNNRLEKAKNENPGFSHEEAYNEASKHVAIPRTSEHELGLALDFNSTDEVNFKNTKEAKWIAKHCSEYGFILRYPEEKQSITGVIYEPWHIRFVGKKHAKRITELGMCLEEYSEYIRTGGN